MYLKGFQRDGFDATEFLKMYPSENHLFEITQKSNYVYKFSFIPHYITLRMGIYSVLVQMDFSWARNILIVKCDCSHYRRSSSLVQLLENSSSSFGRNKNCALFLKTSYHFVYYS